LRHSRAKKNQTDHAHSPGHIPLHYLLALTAVIITTSRTYLTDGPRSAEDVDEMHAAFAKSVMLHVRV